MAETAIHVDSIGKQYRIGVRERYGALRDRLVELAQAPARQLAALARTRNGEPEDVQHPSSFWALRDVSFDVDRGEVLGIVGRNGAGKSTLLKILARVTAPTEGYARIRGRVGSLLEVGTGFHPELTGRENVFLSGTILGMRRREIQSRFDEIVAFAEVEAFIDTPVKRYSSGMQVRLGFAIAAHLEPEVLLVDEVLAVGDARFQKKCLGKIGDVVKEGRTVLFVSHNMAAVLSLCPRSILIESGRIVADSGTREVVERYLRIADELGGLPLADRADRTGNQRLRFVGVELRNSEGEPVRSFASGQDVALAVSYESRAGKPLRNVEFAIPIHGKFDERLLHLSTDVTNAGFEELPGQGTVVCRIPRLPLQPGRYSFNLFCTVNDDIADWVQHAGVFDVEEDDFFGTGKLPPANQGAFLVGHSWGLSGK